jgi:hypothetical protein
MSGKPLGFTQAITMTAQSLRNWLPDLNTFSEQTSSIIHFWKSSTLKLFAPSENSFSISLVKTEVQFVERKSI